MSAKYCDFVPVKNVGSFVKLYVHYLIKSIRTSLRSSKLKPRCHYDLTYQYKRRQKAVCCSLVSSTSSTRRSGELSDFERGLVIGCHISKESVRDIETLLKSQSRRLLT
jgi:hypothetical protein